MKKKSLFVEMDATDNSITFSPDLCKELKSDKGVTFIHMFLISNEKGAPKDKQVFGMKRVKQSFAKVTACEILSKNPITETMGIMANNPTVMYMFYMMKIDKEKAKLSVEKKRLLTGGVIYKIHDRIIE